MSKEGAELETGKKNMASSEDRQEAVNTVQMATKVFKNFTGGADKSIPASVMQNAAGIVIIPDVIKAGLIAGGRRGTGVLVAKNQNNGLYRYSYPLPGLIA